MQKRKFEDVSFLNVFFKQFTIRLVVFTVLLAITLPILNNFMCDYAQNKVVSTISQTSLKIGEISKSELAQDKQKTSIRAALTSTISDLLDDGLVTMASMSLYNTKTKQLIANSYQMPITMDDSVIQWWRTQINSESTTPIISLTDEMMEFMREYNDKELIANGYYCINSVITPKEILAIENNKIIASLSGKEPSIVSASYDMETIIKLVGNSPEDELYIDMKNFVFESINEKNNFDVVYPEITHNSMNKYSQSFCFDDVRYQVDCCYQINFWSNAISYVLICEVIGILLCALFAFIATKNSKARV